MLHGQLNAEFVLQVHLFYCKFIFVHTMADCGSGGTAPLVVSLGHKWRQVVTLPLRPFLRRVSSPRYPVNGLQRRSGHFGNERFCVRGHLSRHYC